MSSVFYIKHIFLLATFNLFNKHILGIATIQSVCILSFVQKSKNNITKGR